MNVIYVSTASAVIAFFSFLFNFLTYRARVRLEQANNATKLHEKWWSEEYYSARIKVYNLIEDWNCGDNSGEKSRAFLDYYSNPKEAEIKPDETKDFVKLVFFFSDLNVYIDERLISVRLAYRLLGDSQYAWFQDFIREVRARRASRQDSGSPDPDRMVRWVVETKALEQKFDSFRLISQRKKQSKLQGREKLQQRNVFAPQKQI